MRESFASGWKVSHCGDEDNAVAVDLPHDAMLAERRGADCAGGENTGWFEGWDYHYMKSLYVPEEWKKEVLLLEFEGVYHRAEVFVNGIKAAFQPNGYIGFCTDITEMIHCGEDNLIEVIARNADQPNSRWYSGAGIYRPVWLWRLPQTHFHMNGIRIRTIDADARTIRVEISANAGAQVRLEFLDRETLLLRRDVAVPESASLEIELPGTVLWSPDTPVLYTCRATLGEDVREISFGIRTITCDPEHGFAINGRRIILRGACIHHDNGLLGAAAEPCAEERKIRLLLRSGYNAIRSAHNPCSEAMLNACDRLGMLVLDEYADMWYIHKNPYDYADWMTQNWRQDLKSMVDRDYNHPSVIMYSLGNEVSETAQEKGIELCRQMQDYIHSVDDRPVTCGINIFFNYLSSLGLGVYRDDKAKKRASSPAKVRKKAVGSAFFNQLAGLLGSDFMKFGATLHGSDVTTRDCYAVLDVAGYNYGIDRYEKDLRKYPDRIILGSETFCSDAYRFWELARRHPALIGDFVWAGMDYLGEVGVGAWEYHDYAPDYAHGPGWLSAGSGRLDLTGKALGEMAYTRVAFELDPIRIAVVPVCSTNERHSPSAWKMTNAMESWSWEGCEGAPARIEVYARADHVRLFLNGKCLETKRIVKDCRVVFTAAYQPGELTAVACDASGTVIAQTSLQSAAADNCLTLMPEEEVIRTPQDLCYVRMQYTDHNGIVKPLLRGRIRVQVEGGRLIGLGSACPYNEDGFLKDSTDTYYGEALAIIRPFPGQDVTIRADSPYGNAQVRIANASHGFRTPAV